MVLIFPSSFDQTEMLCNQAVLDDYDLCKAKRAGHMITSSFFPAICRQFIGHEGLTHYCLPIVVGGAPVAIIQLVFDTPDNALDKKNYGSKAI